MDSFLEINTNCDFTLQNLPYGVFRPNNAENFRIGVPIGEFILDLAQLLEANLLIVRSNHENIFKTDSLNLFMELGHQQWLSVREQIQSLLHKDNPKLRDHSFLRKRILYPQNQCEMKLPINVGDYTDFYACKYHAENLGKMFRPNSQALLPNWQHMPVAYHGRSSSIVVSGTPVKRPQGQVLLKNNIPILSYSNKLDFEVELGFIIGTGNKLGEPVPMDEVEQHIFGAVLLNDWSARDIQQWEYVPLGPFLSKSFATSISPWVVSMFALKEFMQPAPKQDIPVLEYLQDAERKLLDINLTTYIKSKDMMNYQEICKTNSKYLYWTHKQMIAHHTINGCNLRCGDLLATGTISGPEVNQAGSLIELTWNGQRPIELSDYTQRSFLADWDSILIEGKCINSQGSHIGFGALEGTLVRAK